MQFKGEAVQWHLAFMKYRECIQPPTWNEYVMALVERFGADYDDPMEKIKKVRQTGSVKDYQTYFERNLTRVNLSQENAISCFIGGLKHELNMTVKVANLHTLSQAYKSARMQEAYLEAVRQPVQNSNQPRRSGDQNFQSKPPLLSSPNSSTTREINRRTLSAEEMN